VDKREECPYGKLGVTRDEYWCEEFNVSIRNFQLVESKGAGVKSCSHNKQGTLFVRLKRHTSKQKNYIFACREHGNFQYKKHAKRQPIYVHIRAPERWQSDGINRLSGILTTPISPLTW
jgi:hypothetical protein